MCVREREKERETSIEMKDVKRSGKGERDRKRETVKK